MFSTRRIVFVQASNFKKRTKGFSPINFVYDNQRRFSRDAFINPNAANLKRIHSNVKHSVQFNDKQFLFFDSLFTLSNKSVLQSKTCLPKSSSALFTQQQIRKMSTGKDETTLRDKYKPRDCQFKTPYGNITALEWGEPSAPQKILCMHGWMDNAGSFERLVPFILDHDDNAKKFHIVAMDQPGLGLSSHKPTGAEYTQFTAIIEMRRITQQLGWEKMTLLAHSLGAHYSFIYSCIYPNQVESFIAIDLAHPLAFQVHNWNISVANSFEDHFKYEYQEDIKEVDPTTNIRVPVYGEEDAIKRLMEGHSNSLTRESAQILLKRGATKQRWGYTFNRDMRLRYLSPELRVDDNLMFQYLSGTFRPNLFIIRALRSPYHRPESLRKKYYDLFTKNCPIFRDIMLDGTHHLHMNSPELVAPEINKFLDDVRSAEMKKSIMNKKSNL